jgi:predicted O-linked N-acetylglucosamine transferase (SPINDLY family)
MALKFRDLLKPKPIENPVTLPITEATPAPDTFQRALQLQQQGQWEQAIQLFDAVIALNSEHAQAHYKRANALNALGTWDAALAGYDQAIAIDPAFANAFCNRGTVLERLQRWDEALASYDRSLALNPADALAYYNRGSVLKQLKRFDEALASYEQAIALQAGYVEAFINRGNVLVELQRFAEAVASYDKAIEHRPVHAEAFMGRGTALLSLMRTGEALASYEQAIALKADYAEAYINRGNVLELLQQHEAAVASYQRGIELKPDYAEAYRCLGAALVQLKRFDEAIASYDRAVELKPDQKYLLGARQYAKMQSCDWTGQAPDVERMIEGLKARRTASDPLTVLALLDSLPLQRLAAEIWVREECPPNDTLGPIAPRARADRIRVGYFSADFRIHPVSVLTAELFESHDRARFEITAFAFGPDTDDVVRARLRRAFDRFIDVREQPDTDVALLARKLDIDIAVDLGGFTRNARSKIFALRAAPVQVSYLGYPGTLGTSYIDYLVADRRLVPDGSEQHYAEKIIYLPDSYLVNDTKRPIAERVFAREELGLPRSGVVFCCFNGSFKITPTTFDSWMHILKRVDGGVLWLSEGHPTAVSNLRAEAALRNVDPQRLIFAQPMPSMAAHLARHRAADVFLDTLPYNAHTTASDALWAGVPVLTCAGQAFAARVAASLLTAIDLPELITTTPAQYEDLAVRLATNPAQLDQVRQKLARNRLNTPLFDTARFTRHLESAFVQIYERSHAKLPPDHILVGG